MKRAPIPLTLAALALLLSACTSTPPAPLTPPGTVQRAIPAQVQAPAGLDDGAFDTWLTAQRSRVADERAVAHKQFADAEFTCWRRFAVNDCLAGARKVRRSALDDLRAQELALNQQERDRRTEARLKALDEKQRAADAKSEAPSKK